MEGLIVFGGCVLLVVAFIAIFEVFFGDRDDLD